MKKPVWHLMESERHYHRNSVIAFYGLILLVVFVFAWRGFQNPGSMLYGAYPEELITVLLWMVVLGHQIITYRLITVQKEEQRLRFLLSLPVSRHQIGQARVYTILLLHGGTFAIVSLCALTLMAPTSIGTIYCMFAFSLTLSFGIMLLESRQQRPLLTTVQWLIGIALIIAALSPLGIPPVFSYGSRFDRAVRVHLTLSPLFTLTAVTLGYWYQVRFRQRNTYRE